mgnify:CR=1 FL=1
MKPLDEAWQRIVEIREQIDRERDRIRGRYPHPTASSISIIDIGAQAPNAISKSL